MIVALKPGVTKENREQLMDWLQNLGLHIHVSEGEYQTILGLVGDTARWIWTWWPAWTSWIP